MKKVLVIRTGAIGDVVETTGLVRALKNSGWIVDYLAGETPAQLLQNDDDINKIFILSGKNYSTIIKTAFMLSKEKYDLILNLQPSIRMRILAMLTGGKKIVNYKKSYKYHAVENFFETGKRAVPELVLDKNIHLCIPNNLKEKMQSQLSTNKTKICFNMGASKARQGRKWCLEYWIKLAKLILENYDAQIFVVGDKEDKENAQELIDKFPQIKIFAGETSILETAALLANADIVISGDTGPLHIATATGTTCIGLYGSCPVTRSGPYGEKHFAIASDLSCTPCDKKVCKYINSDIDNAPCMQDISPEKVFNLVDTILKK
ncbi:MAG: glycosyltransferase family 9 protein [bacterium]|nr:glycosyltransferase family 9 protein [bacterium]